MGRPKLVVAAKVLMYVNGKLYAKATSFQWSSATPRRKIRTIDIPVPVELAATTTDVTWTIGCLRIIGDGGLQGSGVVAQQTDISLEKYFSLLLVERTSGLTIFKSDYNNVDSEAWQLASKTVMSGTVSGSGISWVNESAT